MRGAVLYGPRDVRFEVRDEPIIIEPPEQFRIRAEVITDSTVHMTRKAMKVMTARIPF